LKKILKIFRVAFVKLRYSKLQICKFLKKYYKLLAWRWPFRVETRWQKYQKWSFIGGFYLWTNDEVFIVKLYANIFHTNMLLQHFANRTNLVHRFS